MPVTVCRWHAFHVRSWKRRVMRRTLLLTPTTAESWIGMSIPDWASKNDVKTLGCTWGPTCFSEKALFTSCEVSIVNTNKVMQGQELSAQVPAGIYVLGTRCQWKTVNIMTHSDAPNQGIRWFRRAWPGGVSSGRHTITLEGLQCNLASLRLWVD